MKLWWEMYGNLNRTEFDDKMRRRAFEQQFWDEDEDWEV